jgi:hypothetical protein
MTNCHNSNSAKEKDILYCYKMPEIRLKNIVYFFNVKMYATIFFAFS